MLNLFRNKRNPNDVFTPRASEVNPEMYVSRDLLEKRFKNAIEGGMHVFVYGISGAGKSWLYKQYFKKHSIHFRIVDLATAVTDGLDRALLDATTFNPAWNETEKTYQRGLDIKPLNVGASESVSITSQIHDLSAFEKLLKSVSEEKRKGQTGFIVFDNLEQISRNSKVVSEVSSCIVRLDNPRYAQYGVRILMVGVGSDLKEMVARQNHYETIINRITELPEVERLSVREARNLLDTGFKKYLELDITDEEDIYSEIMFFSDRIAQQLHSLGRHVALEAENHNGRIDRVVLRNAVIEWSEESLNQQVSIVSARLNVNETKIRRRDQVIFSIGHCDAENFRASDIDEIVRRTFPKNSSVAQLGVNQILSELSAGNNPLVIRNPQDKSYRLAHPKIRMAIRAMFDKPDNTENLIRRL